MGRAVGRGHRFAATLRPRADVGTFAAYVSGAIGTARRPQQIVADLAARNSPGRDRADRRRDRARFRVRPALQGFSLCRADHGGGAVRNSRAQSPAGGGAPDRGGNICRDICAVCDLYRLQRGPRRLAVAVDLRDLPLVHRHAVAGAGRANPKISNPIAIPHSAILESTIPIPDALRPPVSRTIDGRITCSTAITSATLPNTEFLNR